MLQVWTSKHVLEVAPTNDNKSRYQNEKDLVFPSCRVHIGTCTPSLMYEEIGRVDTLMQSANLLNQWLHKVGTDTCLHQCLKQYAHGQGSVPIFDLAQERGLQFC